MTPFCRYLVLLTETLMFERKSYCDDDMCVTVCVYYQCATALTTRINYETTIPTLLAIYVCFSYVVDVRVISVYVCVCVCVVL